ncbi:MAG: hypothetical protein M0037_00600 [Betaproteobacteria bacterium]|nr:hypothetical protein [Betaproteobacteria bacterium]
MPSTLTPKEQQIVQFHAALIHRVVMVCLNRARLPQLEPMLALVTENGWANLAAAIRQIANGQRDVRALGTLDEEDRAIVGAILRGLQDPTTLPDPEAKPEASAAAPGLAGMIDAAARGDANALHMLAQMAEQMVRAGGDMARLGGLMRQLVNGERDADKLTRGMGGQGRELVYAILTELGRLASH